MIKLNKFFYNECPICLEMMPLDNSIKLLKCCNKLIHHKCYKEMKNKININKCLMCNQIKKEICLICY